MKKKIISCLMIVIVIVLSYFYAHIDKNTYIYDRNADTSTFYGTGILTEGEEIRQTIVAEENVIDGINLKVVSIGSVEHVTVKYQLLDENEEQVAVGKVSGSDLKSNKFNELKFKQITDTEGAKYTLVLSEENADKQNGIGFYVASGIQNNQKLTINENETEGTLVTRILSHRFDLETFIVLLGMIMFVVAFMKVLYKFFK